MNKSYEIIDHTADISVKVSGKDFNELLINSSLAMMDIICDLKTIEAKNKYTIKSGGNSEEQLLVNWLSELLYMHEVKRLLFSDFEIKVNENKEVEGICKGEEIDFSRHDLLNDIKAVTYSGLNIVRKNGILSATITFDI